MSALAGILCLVCDANAPPGSLLCPGCGAPLPLPAVAAAAAVAAPPPTPPLGDATSLVLVDRPQPGARPRGLRLPAERGRCLVVGRHDLDAGIVVDIDLRPLTEPVCGGWTFSRRQARLERDDAGRAWIEALGAAPTLFRPPNAGDDAYETLAPGTRRPLEVGARLYFGNSNGGLLLEVSTETPSAP